MLFSRLMDTRLFTDLVRFTIIVCLFSIWRRAYDFILEAEFSLDKVLKDVRVLSARS